MLKYIHFSRIINYNLLTFEHSFDIFKLQFPGCFYIYV